MTDFTDIEHAIDGQKQSTAGRNALLAVGMLADGKPLDDQNQERLIIVLVGLYGQFSGSTRSAVREANTPDTEGER